MNARAEPVSRLDAVADWSLLNQRWLAAELGRLRARLDACLRPPQDSGRSTAADPDAMPFAEAGAGDNGAAAATPFTPWTGPPSMPPALDRIARLFGLTPFERELLLLVAGLELDRGLRALLPAGVSFAQAMAWLDGPHTPAHWDALSPQAALRHWMLLEPPAGTSFAHAPLLLDERMLHALTGVGALDERLRGLAALASVPPEVDAGDEPAVAAIAGALAAASDGAPPVIAVESDARRPGASFPLRAQAIAAAARRGLRALIVELDELPVEAPEAERLTRRLDREAALAQAAVVLWRDPAADGGADAQRRMLHWIERLHSTTLLLAPFERAALRERISRPLRIVHAPAAHASASEDDASARDSRRRALQQFRVAPALLRAAQSDAGDDDTALWNALREASRGGLEALAQRIDAITTFDELVLPPATLDQLREIAAQLAHRHTVYEDWGLARRSRRGLGIAALFAGDSGTGKTMAAEAIANELKLDLYRIDLASTVSKYIGETEKNLKRLFDAAEASGAVLLFDEADALFGKRSEVKDSHDRYANIEVAYLLQRIEAYRGLAILTTNLRSALDRSFLRRLRFVVQFPFPDEAARERLWRAQLPPEAPQATIDWGVLARAPISGGHIRAATLNAAFAAAARKVPIDAALLAQAVHAEFAKIERSWTGAASASGGHA